MKALESRHLPRCRGYIECDADRIRPFAGQVPAVDVCVVRVGVGRADGLHDRPLDLFLGEYLVTQIDEPTLDILGHAVAAQFVNPAFEVLL